MQSEARTVCLVHYEMASPPLLVETGGIGALNAMLPPRGNWRVTCADVEIIEDTGHCPQIDEPDQTNVLIDGFLANLPAQGLGNAA